MNTCERCGIEFDEQEAENEFNDGVEATLEVHYRQFRRCLCGACAIAEYENGNYFETCEYCGKEFNPEEEKSAFDRQVAYKVTVANLYQHGILCADCAAERLLGGLDDIDGTHDGCNVYVAALTWLSRGKDEDYMFGYSEEELEKAL